MAAPALAPPASSEDAHKRGLACLERRTYQEAIGCFQAAIDLEKQEGAKTPRMKYVSYLGLALALSQGRSEDAVRLCEQAIKREFFDPDLFCNLGIVYLRSRRKGPAFEAFQRGLALQPKHRRILEEMDRYNRRDDPVLSFLPRSHPLNRLAGRMRARLRALFDRAAASEA